MMLDSCVYTNIKTPDHITRGPTSFHPIRMNSSPVPSMNIFILLIFLFLARIARDFCFLIILSVFSDFNVLTNYKNILKVFEA